MNKEVIIIFHQYLHYVSFFFTIIALLTIIIGFFLTIKQLFFSKDKFQFKKYIKEYFDRSVILGLQLLIVADIIDTIIAPDITTILTVFMVVIIRTIMSWELRHED